MSTKENDLINENFLDYQVAKYEEMAPIERIEWACSANKSNSLPYARQTMDIGTASWAKVFGELLS